MNLELDQEFCRRFPEPFVNRAAEDSPMGRGFECGDGWFRLIACLCEALNYAIAQGEMPFIAVSQVKEKFGSLRFHFRGGSELSYGMVRMAERPSEEIDETAGQWRSMGNEREEER